MEIIERYVNAIGNHLPRKQRADIQAEIRSLVEDMLEDRAQGAEPTEEMASAVIKELGSPEKIAAQYAGERYLIGPTSFPLFWLVVRIVMAALTGALLLAWTIGASFGNATPDNLLIEMLKGIPTLFWALVQAFGMIVLVFAILERTVPDFKHATDNEEFKLEDLPEVERTESFRPAELILGIIAICAGLVIFNFYPHWVIGAHGITEQGGEFRWLVVPLLSAAFASNYLLLFNIRWALGLALNFTVLGQRGWYSHTRWGNFALKIFDLFILYSLYVGPSILGLNPVYLAKHGMTISDVPAVYQETLIPLAQSGLKIAFIVAFVVSLVVLIIEVVKYAGRESLVIPLKKTE